MGDYRLSASLKGHEDDVRSIVFAEKRSILSASRDGTVRYWHLKSAPSTDYDYAIVSHSPSFINAITYLPPSSQHPHGLCVSGGKEAIIEVRHPTKPAHSGPEQMLLGHEGNVCALHSFATPHLQYIVSGSWDSSAKVWDLDKGEAVATLEGHSGSVWAVLAYDEERVITGCADHLIRIFSTKGKLLHTVKGSSDVVRALCRVESSSTPGVEFASAGNDAVIRLWSLEGKALRQLHGHDNFIYCLASTSSGEIISCGEDRTLRIWKDSTCVQTISHPAISVWTVAVCPETSDIVSGASDRVVRLFSRAKERQADQSTIKAFEDAVKSSSIPQQTVPEVNKEKLPGPDFLQKKAGTKEGQVQMIREANGSVSAHQWSHLANEWVNVGTVVTSSASSGRKQQHLGQDYDYVFDVDIEDGKPPLKLPYSLTQNPYDVAQKFIADNELPSSYLGQTAEFIIRNTEGATIGNQQPGAPAAASKPRVLPQREFLTITTANLALVCRKAQEFNAQLLDDGRKDLSLSPSELQLLPDFAKDLDSVTEPKSSPKLDAGANLVVKMVTCWPQQQRLPGLDLFRVLCAANPDLNTHHDILETLRESGVFPSVTGTTDAMNPNMTMLGIRALANLFVHDQGRNLMSESFKDVMELVSPQMQPAAGAVSRNLHIAATTLCINYAVQLTSDEHSSAIEASERAQRAQSLLRNLSILLSNPKVVDAETIYRALVGIGTLVRVPGAKDGVGAPTGLDDNVKKAAERAKEPRIRGLIDEMMG